MARLLSGSAPAATGGAVSWSAEHRVGPPGAPFISSRLSYSQVHPHIYIPVYLSNPPPPPPSFLRRPCPMPVHLVIRVLTSESRGTRPPGTAAEPADTCTRLPWPARAALRMRRGPRARTRLRNSPGRRFQSKCAGSRRRLRGPCGAGAHSVIAGRAGPGRCRVTCGFEARAEPPARGTPALQWTGIRVRGPAAGCSGRRLPDCPKLEAPAIERASLSGEGGAHHQVGAWKKG